ncbi:MAG: exodeoxyribonuclease VII large subunit [Clostridiaceae bacterium]|nr:exodeoxyribonuclease VII large subunit [Eubacteriales bacterium]
MDSGYVLSVTQLNEYAKTLIERDPLLKSLGVRGEISGFKRHSSGHLYFSLKDDGALIRCVMFRQSALLLRFEPRDGMSVLAMGGVSIYAKDGQYQFYARSMEEAGEGVLYQRFMMLKTRLEAQGLFDAAHKKPIPFLPKCLGVITSPTGAVLRDILHVVRRRYPSMNVLLYPAKVQGEGAAAEIARAIAEMNRLGRADVLIVGRGGGSMEDLWAFNEEIVARAIYESAIPVVSAVGHETDFSIADFVADLRAPTPSAAAELCVPEFEKLMSRVRELDAAVHIAPRNKLAALRTSVALTLRSSGFAAPKNASLRLRQTVEAKRAALQNASRAAVVGAYATLEQQNLRMEALSPMRVLDRGYALVKKRDGGFVTSVRALVEEREAELILCDGSADISVERIRYQGESGEGRQ